MFTYYFCIIAHKLFCLFWVKYYSGSTNQISVPPTQLTTVKYQSDWSVTSLDIRSYIATTSEFKMAKRREPSVLHQLVGLEWFTTTVDTEAGNNQEDIKCLSTNYWCKQKFQNYPLRLQRCLLSLNHFKPVLGSLYMQVTRTYSV